MPIWTNPIYRYLEESTDPDVQVIVPVCSVETYRQIINLCSNCTFTQLLWTHIHVKWSCRTLSDSENDTMSHTIRNKFLVWWLHMTVIVCYIFCVWLRMPITWASHWCDCVGYMFHTRPNWYVLMTHPPPPPPPPVCLPLPSICWCSNLVCLTLKT